MLSVLLTFVGAGMAFAASSAYPSRAPEATVEPSLASIYASQATATADSPVSNVAGQGFNRIVQIWLENTDYDKAVGDPNIQYLQSQGISLTNYWATTHPSEPNYCAVVGGDNFGMDNDDFNVIPANVSTVVDLLDTKGISWAEYQEGMPYAGFQGYNFSDQDTYANDYVRKHNPLILYESVTSNATRLSLIKNFTSFASDLAAQTLPQWSFLTPNMTDDGHDTTIAFAASWARSFLTPLLNNSYFMNDTLIILTFDEFETYTSPNKPLAILLGGVIPQALYGSSDNTFYNHYSAISTVSVNWGLPSLGRWDCNANVFEVVANKTGYVNFEVDTTSLYFNQSYPGPMSDKLFDFSWPNPTTSSQCAAGAGVLGAVVSTYNGTTATFNYTNPYPYDAADDNNSNGTATKPSQSSTSPSGTASGTASSTGSGTAAASPSSTGTASLKAASVILAIAAGISVLLVL